MRKQVRVMSVPGGIRIYHYDENQTLGAFLKENGLDGRDITVNNVAVTRQDYEKAMAGFGNITDMTATQSAKAAL